MRIFFLFDDTRIRTSEDHQDYKRTAHVLDHSMSQQQWCIYQYFFFTNIYQFFHEDIFFSLYDPWIQPTKTRLISGQSIY